MAKPDPDLPSAGTEQDLGSVTAVRRHVAVFWCVSVVLALFASACGGGAVDSAVADDTAVAQDALAAVESFDVTEDVFHVLGQAAYNAAPPVGGDHFGAWQNCGLYTLPLIDEVAVHSMEHGAVWVTFGPAIDDATLSSIAARASVEQHLLASPHDAVESGLVLSAWKRQVRVDSWTDPAVDAFLDEYLGRRSPTAPEAGASCSGAIGEPPDDPRRGYDDALAQLSEGG